MVQTFKEDSKVEAVAAAVAAKGTEFISLDDLQDLITPLGFGDSSKDGTRTIISRDFKRKKWSKAKHIDGKIHYRLLPLFFEENAGNLDRLVKVNPDNEQAIRDSFASVVQSNPSEKENENMEPAIATQEDEVGGTGENENPEPAAKKRTIIRSVPDKKAVQVRRGSHKFGGAQPPGLTVNGVVFSYSTLVKAILAAQNKPFTRAEIFEYANAVVGGLNQSSIGNGWYQVRKHKLIRESKTLASINGTVYELTNELFLSNLKFIETYCQILPGHKSFILDNLKMAQAFKLRSSVDAPEPPAAEPEPEPDQQQADNAAAEQKSAPEQTEQQEPEKTPNQSGANIGASEMQDIREMAIALGIIETKPAIDPKVFIGECIVSYLEATSDGTGFSAIPKIKPELKPTIPEKPIEKDEYILRLKALHGKLQTMTTAKEKAERLARQLESANFELKQQKATIESELNRLKFQGDRTRLPGETTPGFKMHEVARIT